MSELAKMIARILRQWEGCTDIDKVAMEIAGAFRAYKAEENQQYKPEPRSGIEMFYDPQSSDLLNQKHSLTSEDIEEFLPETKQNPDGSLNVSAEDLHQFARDIYALKPAAGQSEPVADTREHYLIIREAERNDSEEKYFSARRLTGLEMPSIHFRAGFDRGFDAAQKHPIPAAPAVPDGYCIVPHYRGFAKMGAGLYSLCHTAKPDPAELLIVIATDEERATREVGGLYHDESKQIEPDEICVRLEFVNKAGLDALEQQLRLLRKEHFAASPEQQGGEK